VTPRTRLVGIGVGWAIAVALPADLVAQIADAAHTGAGHSPLLFPCAVLIMVGMGGGGAVLAARGADAGESPSVVRRLGALVGLSGVAAVLVLAIGRSLLAGDSVGWASVPILLALGALSGMTGAAIAESRARTSRP
jgi:hypothetical protein